MPNHPSLGRRGIIALVLLFASALAHAAPAVTGMQLLSEKRVSRTVFDYTYRITIQNDTIVRQDVVAHLATAGKGTSIVDGDVSVGRLAPNQQVSPDDTVTLRQDRLVPFDQAALTWTFSGHDVIPVGILVPGDPSALLINAMPDYQAPNLFAPPNEVEVDLNYGANKVIRTALNIVFREDATVGDANAFLNSFNGRIQVSMSGGEAVGVGIPDPGSVPALDALIGILERHPAVVMVLPDYAISLSSIPKTANINSVPEPANSSSDYWGLMHHLTVHAAAAWNARSALTYTTSSRPVFVIADFFYSGEPSPTATQIKWERDPIIPPPGVFNCSLDIDAEHCAHGYHVTGIAFANYGGVNEPDRSVTGMYPSTAGQDTELKGYKLDIAGIPQLKLVEDPVKFVAAQIAGILQRIRTQMELKEQQLRNQSPSTDVTLGKIVLNTSFGYPNPLEVLDSVELARYWKHLLQNNDTKYNIKLVDRVFHSAAAGNSKFRALLSNGWSAAALYNNNDIPDFPLVTNTLVVENRMAYFPRCRFPRPTGCFPRVAFIQNQTYMETFRQSAI